MTTLGFALAVGLSAPSLDAWTLLAKLNVRCNWPLMPEIFVPPWYLIVFALRTARGLDAHDDQVIRTSCYNLKALVQDERLGFPGAFPGFSTRSH